MKVGDRVRWDDPCKEPGCDCSGFGTIASRSMPVEDGDEDCIFGVNKDDGGYVEAPQHELRPLRMFKMCVTELRTAAFNVEAVDFEEACDRVNNDAVSPQPSDWGLVDDSYELREEVSANLNGING